MCLSTGAKVYLALTLLLICCGAGTESLMCFQCEATTATGACITDWFVMANLTTRHLYAKNCTESNANWTRCMILRAEIKGEVAFFHRGCHDGLYFEKHLYNPRFDHLPADNQTTCGLGDELNTAICYTPCDTDFCNGPQLFPEKNCTDPDIEGCRASGIFARTQLLSIELIALFTTLLLVPWFLFNHH